MPLRSLADLVPPPSQTQHDHGVADSCSEDEDEVTTPGPLHEVRNGAGPSRPINRLGLAGSKAATPLLAGRGVSGSSTAASAQASALPNYYYSCQWRKPQTKKHKTWDGDAFLKVEGNKIVMYNEDSDRMGACTLVGGPPATGQEMRIGSYDIEIDSEITADEFKRNTTILNRPQALPSAYAPSTFAVPFRAPTQRETPRPSSSGRIIATSGYTRPGTKFEDDLSVDPDVAMAGPSHIRAVKEAAASARAAISEKSFYATPKPKKADKIVIGEKSSRQRTSEWGGALHDPNADGAVVMQRPSEEDARKRNTEIVDVVLDPWLTSRMRAHQKEGVKFMYSCVMGMTDVQAQGCILADEMGLGKTLQTIALIHTLLKQSPFANESGVIGKALIVCPVTLVDNWRKEFKKWVRPTDHLNVVVADGADHQISSFVNYNRQQVLIIGYERLRKVIKKLAACQPTIDLIVCDEGHRLKSRDNKTTKMFDALRTRRRIILSGTPVQNDLSEYFAMVDFTCPGLLGKYAQFVKHYERPIVKSRSVGCSEKAMEAGRERADELAALSREFVLRRTASVLENYLPPKHEYVVFIAPTVYQLKAFGRVLNPDIMARVLRGEYDKQPLGYIDLLRKISNTPTLLRLKKDDETSRSEHLAKMTETALEDLPLNLHMSDVSVSGKLSALDRLLHSIYRTTQEKVVIVSNWTSTLNIIQEVCKKKRWSYLRLDGSTAQKNRQDLVDSFNRTSRTESFVFLLSAKAGGVGLNLIGASRLILFDSDWNPATDQQAMARIHRDGQKKPVYIYRFLTTNTIDEKIYQRQITKTGLADQMLDQGSSKQGSKDSFSAAELRDIFTLNLRTDGCQTHDLLACKCTEMKLEDKFLDSGESKESSKHEDEADDEDEGPKFISASQYNPEPTVKMQRKAAAEKQEKLAALKKWTHLDGFDKDSFNGIQDTLLFNMISEDWNAKGVPKSGNGDGIGQDGKVRQDDDPLAFLDGEDNGQDGLVPPSAKKPKTTKNKKDKTAHPAVLEGLEGILDSASESEDGEADFDELDEIMESEAAENDMANPKDRSSPSESVMSSLHKLAHRPSASPEKCDMEFASVDPDDTAIGLHLNTEVTPVDDADDLSAPTSIRASSRKRKSDEGPGGIARTAKASDRNKTKGRGGKRKEEGDDDFGFVKKHDLRDVAETGPPGRIMFVFEKISASQMCSDDDVE